MPRVGLDTLLPQCSLILPRWDKPKRRKGLFGRPCPASCAVPACVALLVVLWHRVP